jgi:OPT family oligopeptide transporter
MTQRTDPEAHWIAHVRRTGVPQLTLRAVVVGMLIGVVMCISNLYVFFKTGWSMGVTITAAILAFSAFRGLKALGIARAPFTALENNALTTVASGAGYMTGGGNMAALGALLMVTTVRPPTLPLVAWFAVIAALGVFVAIPIKRQLINQEGLAFPTGMATAETIKSIHAAEFAEAAGEGASGGAQAGAKQSRALLYAGLFAALLTWCRDATVGWMGGFKIPAVIGLPFTVAGRAALDWTLALKAEVVLVGAGALMSFRTAWSLLLGGVLTYAFLAPSLVERGLVTGVSYKEIVKWTVWPGASLLVAAGLTSFALDWRSIARSFSGLSHVFRKRGANEVVAPIDEVECPAWWFPAGFLALSPLIVFLMAWLFQIPIWAALIALPLSIVMGFVAARVTGETDVTPTKALGPVTQLIYGAVTPGNLPGNIMSGNVTGGVGLHAADLLTTLKTGWLLGGDPRAQFRAQLVGVVVGALVIVPAFRLLIPDPAVLGTEGWPAPSCVVWAGVSEAFAHGLGALGGEAKLAAAIGLILGVALALAERFAPSRAKAFVPSPSGLGLSMVLPGSNVIAMFLGGLMAEILRRVVPRFAASYVVPMASGLIAGESLMGVAIVALKIADVMPLQ